MNGSTKRHKRPKFETRHVRIAQPPEPCPTGTCRGDAPLDQIVDIVHDLVVFIGAEEKHGTDLYFPLTGGNSATYKVCGEHWGTCVTQIPECVPYWALFFSQNSLLW